ncbi:hypothetical protein [Dyadobacter sp. CY312]|uniref:hypothetical protein n=1 Tax=Dyadobacter sp. CY312 TaxID=2907303 RepID=UPI001F23C359|nr:hypothetical protein [Dyadobacter sp. CY312]MCE7039278.1 hypothetical protein [Dyadobacter sp. CY312]
MKTCDELGCNYAVWGRGKCKGHQRLLPPKPKKEKVEYPRMKPKVAKEKKPKPISKTSKKYAKELSIYHRDRIPFLEANPICQFPGCGCPSTDLHHAGGRGKNLNVKKLWRALCRPHHDWAENNPVEAKKINLSVSRLAK